MTATGRWVDELAAGLNLGLASTAYNRARVVAVERSMMRRVGAAAQCDARRAWAQADTKLTIAFARANLVTLKAVLTNPLTRRSVVEWAIAASVVTSPHGDHFIVDGIVLWVAECHCDAYEAR